MQGIELAKAYVQIIPSAEGIKGKLTNLFGGEADEAGKTAGNVVGSGLVSTVKKVVAAAGIGAIIKQSLTEGAALQQSFGGIETIYGEAAEAAKKYAAEAVSAGISMNTYAEQAVSFGAALKNAFDGDMTKAAEAANTAIMDMADNSAKMGTDIEAVQNAYQGFAKQNYTMLDNLKLGYGGTKSEMQRLLTEAEKLSGIKYNIDNLGDVYDAIHVIQEDLGITGVAADEAKTTFTGSMTAMKSAATNLLANLSLGEDIKQAMSALIQSTGTFVFGNLIPMLGNIMQGVVGYVIDTAVNTDWSQVITEILASIRDYLSNGLKEYFGADTTFVNDMFGFLIDGVPKLITDIQRRIQGLLEAVTVVWEEIGKPIFDTIWILLTELYETITEKLPEIEEFVSECFEDIALFWEENLKPCLNAIGIFLKETLAPVFIAVFKGTITPLINTVFNFIKSMWNDTLKPVFIGITDFLTGVFTLNFKQAWEGIKNILKGIINGMITIIEGFINRAISGLNGLFNGANVLLNKVGGIFGISEIPLIASVSLPRLKNGGILERGQIGLLEGSGAEAVVPLENNSKWISKVAKDMNSAIGNERILVRILELIEDMRDKAPIEMAEIISNIRIAIGEREFAKLVREVE